MLILETPGDVADQVADWLEVYGAHSDACTEGRPCRSCFVLELTERMRQACEDERKSFGQYE